LIDSDTPGLHRDRPQAAIAQMPQIACPDALEWMAIGELRRHDVSAIAHLSRHRTLVRCCLWHMGSAEGGLQDNPSWLNLRWNHQNTDR
jgi:hypothetical protein